MMTSFFMEKKLIRFHRKIFVKKFSGSAGSVTLRQEEPEKKYFGHDFDLLKPEGEKPWHFPLAS